MMKKKIHFVSIAVALCLVSVVIYAHAQFNSTPTIPPVEINARFDVADKDGNGSVDKQEFAQYFAQFSRKPVSATVGKICPKTGKACAGNCEHEQGASSASAETVPVKAVTETPVKAGGCCGGKKDSSASAETVPVKAVTETPVKAGGCCGGKKDSSVSAETVPVKAVTETPVKAGGCCGGKKDSSASAETVPVKAVTETPVKASGCCGGKKDSSASAETVPVKAVTETPVKAGGCCGGKSAKAVAAPTVKAATLSPALLESVLNVTDALAADDLASYQKHLPALLEAVTETTGELHDTLVPLAKKLVAGTDLATAREPFESFSNTLSEFVRAQPAADRQAKIFQCTMTPVLGTANWLQKDNKVTLNPFHGSNMLHCGTELN